MPKSNSFKFKTLIGGLACGAVLSTNLSAVQVAPDFVPDFEITVSDGKNSDTINLEKLLAKFEKKTERVEKGGKQWNKTTLKLLEALEFKHGNDVLGTITGLDFIFNEDPFISLGFTVFAGAADTTFTISSATMPVGLAPATGFATAGVTLTDTGTSSGGSLGATLTGLRGGKAYEALYNGGGSSFATLVPPLGLPIVLPGAGTITVPETFGPVVNAGPIVDMQSVFEFKLTKRDLASGTSFYEWTPANVPDAGSALLLLGTSFLGFSLCGRRKA